ERAEADHDREEDGADDELPPHPTLAQCGEVRRQHHGTTATPHGRVPTFTVRSTFIDPTSTTDRSSVSPFAVYAVRPSGESATPQGRGPTGTRASSPTVVGAA